MTLTMSAFNNNRSNLVPISNGDSLSINFTSNITDYGKWKISLLKGQTIVLNQTAATGDMDLYFVFEDSTLVANVHGSGNLSQVIPKTGDYYLFLRRLSASGGSYSGQVTVSAPALTYSAWRNLYSFPPGAEYAMRDTDNDGLFNFAEYALDTDPLRPTALSQFQTFNFTPASGSSFSITKPKYATAATHHILSGTEIRNLNNRAVQIIQHPSDAGMEIISVADPVALERYYKLSISEAP